MDRKTALSLDILATLNEGKDVLIRDSTRQYLECWSRASADGALMLRCRFPIAMYDTLRSDAQRASFCYNFAKITRRHRRLVDLDTPQACHKYVTLHVRTWEDARTSKDMSGLHTSCCALPHLALTDACGHNHGQLGLVATACLRLGNLLTSLTECALKNAVLDFPQAMDLGLAQLRAQYAKARKRRGTQLWTHSQCVWTLDTSLEKHWFASALLLLPEFRQLFERDALSLFPPLPGMPSPLRLADVGDLVVWPFKDDRILVAGTKDIFRLGVISFQAAINERCKDDKRVHQIVPVEHTGNRCSDVLCMQPLQLVARECKGVNDGCVLLDVLLCVLLDVLLHRVCFCFLQTLATDVYTWWNAVRCDVCDRPSTPLHSLRRVSESQWRCDSCGSVETKVPIGKEEADKGLSGVSY